MSRGPAWAATATAVLLVCLAAPTQAGEQPEATPSDFRNGMANGFGRVGMEPYLQVGGQATPVTARFLLTDLEVLGRAANVMFAFNLKSDAAKVTLESLSTAGGKVLTPTRTTSIDDGRQPQLHFAPAALVPEASEGRLELVLRGVVAPSANSQSHLGAMVIAFDESWDTLQSVDGPAMLYGFTMVMATGVGVGAMPFQGKGNTWVALPFVLLAFAGVASGGWAVNRLRVEPAPPPPPWAVPLPVGARPAATPAAARGPPPSGPPRPLGVAATPSAIPVFGGPASPPVAATVRAAPRPAAPPIRPAAPAAPARPAVAPPPAAAAVASWESAGPRPGSAPPTPAAVAAARPAAAAASLGVQRPARPAAGASPFVAARRKKAPSARPARPARPAPSSVAKRSKPARAPARRPGGR